MRGTTLAVLGLLVAACGTSPAGTALIHVHQRAAEGGMTAIVSGDIEYDPDIPCVWLGDEFGSRYPVVWPQGTSAKPDPLEITLPDGSVAREGDRVSGGGGFVPIYGVDLSVPAACVQSGDVAFFNADSEITVEAGDGPVEPVETLFGRFSIPESVGLELISVNSNARSVAVSELVEGTIHLFEPSQYEAPSDVIDGASGGGGFVHLWSDGTVYSYTGRLSEGEPLVYSPEPLLEFDGAASTLSVVPAPDGERIWLVQDGDGVFPTQVELINLVEVQVARLGSWEVEGSWQPAGVTVDGLILNSNAGPDRAVLVGVDGSITADFDGHAISVGWNSVGVLTPEGSLVVTDARLGGPTEVDAPAEGEWTSVGGPLIPSTAPPLPTGAEKLLVGLGSSDGRRSLVVLEPDGGASVLIEFGNSQVVATWSRAGGEVLVVDSGGVATLVDLDGTVSGLGDIVPPNHWTLSAG